MDFDLKQAIEILDSTPKMLTLWLRDLPEEWVMAKDGADSWSAFDVLGHLIHGEETDWIPRAKIILSDKEPKVFEPFDRMAQFETSKGKSLPELLDLFASLRRDNLRILRSFNLEETDFNKTGGHPELGQVTMKQLLATWAVHDLNHIRQIAEVLARQYDNEVGPWKAYLGILEP